MFHGLYVALVTPFRRDGSLNEDKLRELVSFHADNGTDGLVPCGTTGENPSYFSWDEHFRIVETVVREARGRLKVVAGAGTNSTTRSKENVKRVQEIGADGTSVNVALPPGTGDKHWLRAFDTIVPPLLTHFAPEALVTQHGCDSHDLDPLAHLCLSVDGHRVAYEALHRIDTVILPT